MELPPRPAAPAPKGAGRSPARRCARATALAITLLLALPGMARGLDLDDVAERARKLAAQEYRDPGGRVPGWLTDISYDAWRDIRFRPERALWREADLPFEIQFFHPGLFYDRLVQIHVVDAEGVHPVPFSPALFDYGRNEFASRVPQDLGFAGFRVHHPINRPDYKDEVIVFLGASYFRAVARGNVFGLSARGLAIDTALPSGEEFPWFRRFWIVRPSPGAKELQIFALLDSPSLTGAYRFVVRPGEETVVGVESRLFRRTDVEKLGIAPLTSMFLHGENTQRTLPDYRPEVHDSDGLLLTTGAGEWIWRPLENPEHLHVAGFQVDALRGFGLLQRDRDFGSYQDLEARPDLRPTLWVVPRGEWGPGRVELVEIPTRDDTNDNIVAYFVPRGLTPPGTPLTFDYDLHWNGASGQPPGGWVVATRRDVSADGEVHRFVVDFHGPTLERLPADTVLRGVVTVGRGADESALLEQQVIKNPVSGGWRLVFRVRPTDGGPLELRAFLARGDEALTETWSYALRP